MHRGHEGGGAEAAAQCPSDGKGGVGAGAVGGTLDPESGSQGERVNILTSAAETSGGSDLSQ